MTKLNNKGQSLVLFVLLLPIMILVLILVIDVGNAISHKQELDNINYLAIEYGLEHFEDSNLETRLNNMIIKNNNKLSEINISIENDKIVIILKRDLKGIIANSLKILEIESKYEGYIKDNKKVIERV